MELAIVTVMHGRHDLTALWAEHTVVHGLPIYASITAGDATLRAICERHGIVFVEAPNSPLGAKHNAALRLCGASRVMLLPSDDFVAPAWVDKVRDTPAPYLYPDTCGLFDVATRRACVLRHRTPGSRKFGAGRVISREVLDRVGDLWTDGIERGLDSDSHARIVGSGFDLVHAGIGAVPVVDVKAGENLWPFNQWGNSLKVTPEQVMQGLSVECRTALLSLC